MLKVKKILKISTFFDASPRFRLFTCLVVVVQKSIFLFYTRVIEQDAWSLASSTQQECRPAVIHVAPDCQLRWAAGDESRLQRAASAVDVRPSMRCGAVSCSPALCASPASSREATTYNKITLAINRGAVGNVV
mgnify:CR=1 FL=1